MKTTTYLAALATIGLLGGCAGEPRPMATAGQGELVLLCTLKPGADPSAVIPAANDLSRLPGVLDVTAAVGHRARNLSGEAPGDPNIAYVTFVATLRPTSERVDIAWSPTLVAGGYMDKLLAVDAIDGTLQNYLVSKSFVEETTASDIQRRSAAIKQQTDLRSQTK